MDREGKEIGVGSGFLHHGQIVTNAHVVADAAWVEVINRNGELVTTSPYAVYVDTTNDLAILPFPGNTSTGLRLATRKAEIGDPVWAYGSPMGLQNSVSTGVLSAEREMDGVTLLQLTAPISTGSSGGPVTNADGEVIGIVVSTYQEAQNINFAVPVGVLPKPIAPLKTREPFPEASELSDKEDLSQKQKLMLFSVMKADTIKYGQYVTHSMTDEDNLGDQRFKVYMFEGHAGQNVEITALGSSRSVTLLLYQADFESDGEAWSIEDFEGGLGELSLIRTTLPADGVYFVALISDEHVDQVAHLWLGNPPDSFTLDERWEQLWETSDAEFYIDTKTLVKGSPYGLPYGSIWSYTYYHRWQEVEGNKYDRVISLVEVNCATRTFAFKSMRFIGEDFDERLPMGPKTWHSPEPSSLGEAYLDLACP